MTPASFQPHSRAREVSEHEPQLHGTVKLIVAEARQHQPSGLACAAPQQPEHIERGLVSPMHVFEHDDRRSPSAQLADHARSHLIGPRPSRH